MINPFQFIYGPVYSWRLGSSLGVDPLSQKSKVCNMDCAYCQLGRSSLLTDERREYVPVGQLMEEINRVPRLFIDHITFSGRGEPTLAKNLGDMIKAVKEVRNEKVAVITNSLLMYRKDVQDDLLQADYVLAKLDAVDQHMFEKINGPSSVDFDGLLKGLADFRLHFKGKLALQIMLMHDNIGAVREFGRLAQLLGPNEVQLNTPLRACGIEPLNRLNMQNAKRHFAGLEVTSCFDTSVEKYAPMDEAATRERHGRGRKIHNIY